jgi:DNA repair protein RadA
VFPQENGQASSVAKLLGQLKPRLEESGFKSLNDIVLRGATALSQTTGLDLKTCQDIFNQAQNMLAQQNVLHKRISMASDVHKKSQNIETISTGSHNFDGILGGRGIETVAVTQFYGQPGSGKTQLCHCLATIVTQPKSHGGLGAKALYIDTEGTFRSERIQEISESRGFDIDQVFNNIMVADVQDVCEQEAVLKEAESSIVISQNVKLLLVDSLINHYKAEYPGRSMLAERQHKINVTMHQLQKIARTCRVAVVITNQVQYEPDSFVNYRSEPMAIGGYVLAHASTHILRLRPSGTDRRTAIVVKSPSYPPTDARFSLGEKGIEDSEDSSEE